MLKRHVTRWRWVMGEHGYYIFLTSFHRSTYVSISFYFLQSFSIFSQRDPFHESFIYSSHWRRFSMIFPYLVLSFKPSSSGPDSSQHSHGHPPFRTVEIKKSPTLEGPWGNPFLQLQKWIGCWFNLIHLICPRFLHLYHQISHCFASKSSMNFMDFHRVCRSQYRKRCTHVEKRAEMETPRDLANSKSSWQLARHPKIMGFLGQKGSNLECFNGSVWGAFTEMLKLIIQQSAKS